MISPLKNLLFWLLAIALLHRICVSEQFKDWDEKPSLALKFNFGNPHGTDWLPKYGGALEVEYAFFRYFSLGGGFDVNSSGIKPLAGYKRHEWPRGRALDFEFIITPRIRFPLVFESLVVVPYIVWPVGIGFGLVESIYSGMGSIGAQLGSKIFFTKNWGTTLEYGFRLEGRNTQPAYLMMSHASSLGLVYAF